MISWKEEDFQLKEQACHFKNHYISDPILSLTFERIETSYALPIRYTVKGNYTGARNKPSKVELIADANSAISSYISPHVKENNNHLCSWHGTHKYYLTFYRTGLHTFTYRIFIDGLQYEEEKQIQVEGKNENFFIFHSHVQNMANVLYRTEIYIDMLAGSKK